MNPLSLLNRYRLEAFHAHCALVDQLFLKPWAHQLSQQQPKSQQRRNWNWNCVMVDDRPSQQARICILNTLLMTRLQAQVSVYTTTAQAEAFAELLAPLKPWVEVQTIGGASQQQLGWRGYNQLLKSEHFWHSLTGEQILIFQPDALLIQPLELNQLHFSYAGPPWNKGRITSCEFPVYNRNGEWTGNEWINQALCQSVPDTNNGNGGLSIRNRKLMQQICADQAETSSDAEAEDIFFARHLHSGDYEVNLPSQQELRQLFNETSYTDSHGFHGSWFYLDASEQAKLYEKHAKHIIGILKGLSA